MPLKALEAIELTASYGDAEVVSSVSFEVGEGEFVGVVGPNGSGKTTLIKCFLGLVQPTRGVIRLFGEDQAQFFEWSRVGYVPQVSRRSFKRFPATVSEIVASGLLSRKLFPRRYRKGDAQAVDDIMERLGVIDLKRRRIESLSGGQQQRVFLARALVSKPDLLFLDEPTVALDPSSRERFYELLYTLNRSEKKTIVLVTHDSGTIGEYATTFLYLDRKLVFFGGFDSFCHSPDMTLYFGEHAQHLICKMHGDEKRHVR